MNFALHHFFDILCILVGLAYGFSTIGKSSKNPRGLFLYRLAALMLFVGGDLGLLHGFPKSDWVHSHSYAIFYYGWTFKNVGFGMMVTLVFLGVYKDLEPSQKASQP
jgi:uncharacterized membrane protein YbjE (DUF340 family)